MTSLVRRAGAFAALCTLSLAVPFLGPERAAPIAVVLLLVAVVVTNGPVFELFAYPSDYEDGRLFGLLTFVLAASTLGLIATTSSMPLALFVATVLLVGYGGLAEALARAYSESDVLHATAFCLVGALAAVGGQLLSRTASGAPLESALPVVVFLAVSGALLAALLRDVLLSYDDPIILLTIGFLLWLLNELEPAISPMGIAVALIITIGIGYVSHVLGTASVTGMLTGILLALLTIVLGGYDWFAVLISFFAIGSLSTKFRYEEKDSRGVAEGNDGARGSGNVLGNAAVALAAVLGYAASSASILAIDPDLFLFAFAGSVATALSDTLSSEIGAVFDRPRLITTLEPVEPGTDGGVTWQGEVAGFVGAAVVAVIAYGFFPEIDTLGALIVIAAGIAGMTVDSVLGATLEGTVLGNQGVNFLATLSGALFCMLLVLSLAGLG